MARPGETLARMCFASAFVAFRPANLQIQCKAIHTVLQPLGCS